jgi:HPt (histidine-containing phosphotransfer) domain-containing protein
MSSRKNKLRRYPAHRKIKSRARQARRNYKKQAEMAKTRLRQITAEVHRLHQTLRFLNLKEMAHYLSTIKDLRSTISEYTDELKSLKRIAYADITARANKPAADQAG